MTLPDTSIWIAYFNGTRLWQTDYLDTLLRRELVAVGDLVLAEVLQGFRRDEDFARAKLLLSRQPFFHLGGYDVAVASAENYRSLRSRGVTVRKTIDMLIATACLKYGLTLLHADRDFDVMERELGLAVVKR